MIWPEAVFALLVALTISALLLGPARWRHPRTRSTLGSWVFLLLTIFLFTWAVGTGMRPFGPWAWNFQWLPFLWMGVLIGLVLLAVASVPLPRDSSEKPPDRRIEAAPKDEETGAQHISDSDPESEPAGRGKYMFLNAVSGIFGFFFWILTAALIVFMVVQVF